jgi:hypothetical protein
MIQRIKNYVMTAATVLMVAVPGALSITMATSVSADNCAGVPSAIAGGAANASGGSVACGATDNTTSTVQNLAKEIVNIFSIIVGAASVVMIIYGGFRYITSGGDSSRVGNAKNTLIYAVVGLIIVALAQVIVQFVISKATSSVT